MILTLIKCRIMTILYFARIWNIVPGLSPDQPSRVHVPALAAAVKVSGMRRMRMAGGQGRLETVADCGTERGQLPAEYKLNIKVSINIIMKTTAYYYNKNDQ